MTDVREKKPTYLADLDGTLAILNGRNPYDGSTCHLDLPNTPVIEVVRRLTIESPEDAKVRLICLSGREEKYRLQTTSWLHQHRLSNLSSTPVLGFETLLYMRPTGDFRKDAIIKEELYRQHIEPEHLVLAVFDDRKQVVEMWRRIGLTCMQVAAGDF